MVLGLTMRARLRPLLFGGLAVCASILALWALRSGLSGESKPQCTIPHDYIRLADGKPGETVRGTFEIWNHGAAPLEYTLSASCGCTGLEPPQGTVAGGRSATINVAIRLDDHYGGGKAVLVRVATNDPAASNREVSLRADCPAPFEVAPDSISLGRVSEGEHAETIIMIRGRGDAALPSADADWSVVGEAFNARVAEFVNGELRLAVALKEDVARGTYAGELRLRAPDGEELTVPIGAEVTGEVTVVPAVLRVSAGERAIPAVLIFRTDGAPLGELVASELPEGWSISEDVAGPRGGKRVTLSTVTPPVAGNYSLRLTYEGLTVPAELPVLIANPLDVASASAGDATIPIEPPDSTNPIFNEEEP